MSPYSFEQTLQAQSLQVKRANKTVLKDVSCSLRAGELLGILGANGAGKSSLLSALAGELGSQVSESVLLNGHVLSQLPLLAQARQRAVLPQESSLGFDLLGEQVLAMGAYAYPHASAEKVSLLITRAAKLADVQHLLERHYLQLSGGERQRLHFARVLMQILIEREHNPDTRYLLLDEPTSSLDPQHQMRLLRTVSELAHTEHLGVLVVLHDVNLAARWCSQLLLLHEQTVLAMGSPHSVLTSANLERLYGLPAMVFPHPLDPSRPMIVFQ